MPIGIYIRTKNVWNKGLTKQTDKRIRLMGEKHKGFRHTEESKRKMSQSLKGRVTWNKGKKLHYKVWNKGLTKETNEIIKKESELHKGRKLSEETKRKLSELNKGEKNPNYGKHFSKERIRKIVETRLKNGSYKVTEETKKKLSLAQKKWLKNNRSSFFGKHHTKKAKKLLKKARAKQVLPLKDTSIEVKIQMFLKELGYEFFTHQYMNIEHNYQCDILIPALNLVVECDGDYWHKYPIGLEKDHIRTKELIEKGFKVLRLWENEIKVMDINSFKNKLKGG